MSHSDSKAIRVLIGDSVWEDAELTLHDGWLRIDFKADDLDSITLRLYPGADEIEVFGAIRDAQDYAT